MIDSICESPKSRKTQLNKASERGLKAHKKAPLCWRGFDALWSMGYSAVPR
jgi:hypothetical protein